MSQNYSIAAQPKDKNKGDSKTRSFEDISDEVIAELRDGSHEAFMVIYCQFYQSIYNFIYSLTRSQAESEDLTQNVFANIWERRAGLDPSKSMRAYLYGSSKYCILQHFRKLKVESKYINYTELSSDTGYSSEQEFIARETEILVELALGRMPEMRRKVYEMRQYENLSYDEISRKLGISARKATDMMYLTKKEIAEIIAMFIIAFVAK